MAIDHSGLEIAADQFVLGFLSFFTVALGGLLVGIFVGLISALITRTTQGSVITVVEFHSDADEIRYSIFIFK